LEVSSRIGCRQDSVFGCGENLDFRKKGREKQDDRKRKKRRNGRKREKTIYSGGGGNGGLHADFLTLKKYCFIKVRSAGQGKKKEKDASRDNEKREWTGEGGRESGNFGGYRNARFVLPFALSKRGGGAHVGDRAGTLGGER